MKWSSMGILLLLALTSLLLAGCAFQLLEAPQDELAPAAPVAETGELPAIYVATNADYVAGEWVCDQADGHQVIRLELDGRISRVLGPEDAIDIGYFWFKNDEFHVMSDVDGAAHESVFHVIVETDATGTHLRLEQCGGNCPNAAEIEWLEGLTLVESKS